MVAGINSVQSTNNNPFASRSVQQTRLEGFNVQISLFNTREQNELNIYNAKLKDEDPTNDKVAKENFEVAVQRIKTERERIEKEIALIQGLTTNTENK